MVILLEEIVGLIFKTAIGWYLNQIDLIDPVKALMFFCFDLLLVKIFLTIFPFLKPIAYWVTWPFPRFHNYFHVQAALELEEEIIEEREREKFTLTDRTTKGNTKRGIELGVYNRFESGPRGEGSNIFLVCNTLDDIIKVAMAPWKFALGFFIIYVLSLPLAKYGGLGGFIIHLWAALVFFHALIPSFADYEMIFNTMLTEGLIHKFCIYWALVIFFTILFENFLRTKGNLLFALVVAQIWVIIYFTLLMASTKFIRKSTELKYPVLLRVPDDKSSPEIIRTSESKRFPSFVNEMDY